MKCRSPSLEFLVHLFDDIVEKYKVSNTKERNNILGDKNKMLMSIPFGAGFKYLIDKQFSIALEFEIKKTFYDKIDITSGPIPSSTPGTLNKNYQYGNYNLLSLFP